MTSREQILAKAGEAGIGWALGLGGMQEFLIVFYTIAHEDGRMAEREEYAKVCDTDWNGDADTYAYSAAANECAEAIRARSTK